MGNDINNCCLVMIGVDWYKKSKFDKKVLKYMDEQKEVGVLQ